MIINGTLELTLVVWCPHTVPVCLCLCLPSLAEITESHARLLRTPYSVQKLQWDHQLFPPSIATLTDAHKNSAQKFLHPSVNYLSYLVIIGVGRQHDGLDLPKGQLQS